MDSACLFGKDDILVLIMYELLEPTFVPVIPRKISPGEEAGLTLGTTSSLGETAIVIRGIAPGVNPLKYTAPDGNYLGIKAQNDRNADRRKIYYDPKFIQAWIESGKDVRDIQILIDNAEQNDLSSDVFFKSTETIAKGFNLSKEEVNDYAVKEQQRFEDLSKIKQNRGERAVNSMMDNAKRKYDQTYDMRGGIDPETGKPKYFSESERKHRAETEANKIIDDFIEKNK